MTLNKEDIKNFYNFFNHENPTEIRVFDNIKYPKGKCFYVKNQKEFLKQVEELQKKGLNVYIGGRDRIGKGDKNVISSEHIFFEVDEHDMAKPEELRKVKKFCKDNNIKIGMTGPSGGGFHFYVPHKKKILKTEEDRKTYKKVLIAFKDALIDYGIDIDTVVFNLERVSRVLGTYNFTRSKISKILEINKNIDIEENNKAIIKVINKYENKKPTVDKNAIELLKKYEIDKTDAWLYDLVKNKIIIKEDTGGNSIVLKNAAILLSAKSVSTEELKVIGKGIAECCEGRNLAAFMGWIRKVKSDELSEVNEVEINKFIEKNKYKLTKYVKSEDEHEIEVIRVTRKLEGLRNREPLYVEKRIKEISKETGFSVVGLRDEFKKIKTKKEKGIKEKGEAELDKRFKKPDLLNEIWIELNKSHILDNKEKLGTFIITISGYLPNPKDHCSAAFKGDSSTGKDNLQRAVLKHIPIEDWAIATRITRSELEDRLSHWKILAISEINQFRDGGSNADIVETFK